MLVPRAALPTGAPVAVAAAPVAVAPPVLGPLVDWWHAPPPAPATGDGW